MPPGRLVVVLSAVFVLSLAPAASARDWKVDAVDWQFAPSVTKVAVGDSVTWSFTVAGHTSTSDSGQAESWNSASHGSNPAGTTYTHRFTKPGRFSYYCIPHQAFMTGVVEVSAGAALASLATKRYGHSVRLRFRLRRPAKVVYKLTGPSSRKITRRRLGAGRHRLRVSGLRSGAYSGVLTATDDSGKKSRRHNSFRIP
jgi:plastocyanin